MEWISPTAGFRSGDSAIWLDFCPWPAERSRLPNYVLGPSGQIPITSNHDCSVRMRNTCCQDVWSKQNEFTAKAMLSDDYFEEEICLDPDVYSVVAGKPRVQLHSYFEINRWPALIMK